LTDAIRRAVVVATRPGAAVGVGGLPLAVRSILALRAAGFDDLSLMAPDRPDWATEPLARRGVHVGWEPLLTTPHLGTPGLRQESTLFLDGDVLVDAVAAGFLRGAPAGPVRTAAGRVVGEVRSTPPGEDGCGGSESPARSDGRGTRIMEGLVVPLATAGSPGRLERALLDHLAARPAGDSYLAAVLDRPMSRGVTRLLLRTAVTPTHVTLLGIVTGLLGALGLATVSYWGRVGGVLLLIVSLVLDCVDGDLARARLDENPMGARLDVIGDYLVNLAVFAGLAIGLWREGLPPGGGWAALALVGGVGGAMTTIHLLFIRPVLRRGGDLHWAGDAGSLRGQPGASVLEKLASRDYTYLLLLLAIVGHLEWFLYAAASGAWLFTAGVLAYALFAYRRGARGAIR
jgi:phosphatidylglycerophosphate synthase